MKDMKDFYEEYWEWREGTRHLAQNRMPNRLKIVCSMIEADKSVVNVLDIGCGEGGVGMLLKGKYGTKVHIVGVDISQKSIEFAKPYYDKVIQADVENEDISTILGDQKFDYVITVEVLEHLFKPETLLDKLKKSLEPKGRIIVSFPNFAFWSNRVDLLLGRYPRTQHLYSDVEHIHYWTYPDFVKFLNVCELQIEEIDGDFILPFSRLFLTRGVRAIGKKFPNLLGFQIIIKTKIKGTCE